MRRSDLSGALGVVAAALAAGNINAIESQLSRSALLYSACQAPNYVDQWDINDLNLPENSVAVIRMRGMLYAWETDNLIHALERIEANPCIVGVVLDINGPGGHVTRVDEAAALIRNFSKPVATFVAGDMCSAHFWIGTSAERTFVCSNISTVGSVGSMTEYLSLRKYLEAQGIKVWEIYPDNSDLKNEGVRALEDREDDAVIKQRLAEISQLFGNDVALNLGIKYDPAMELFRGKTFSAAAALAAGYIDQFGTLRDAANWVLAQATSRQAALLYQ